VPGRIPGCGRAPPLCSIGARGVTAARRGARGTLVTGRSI
jgi:hypothetical protein